MHLKNVSAIMTLAIGILGACTDEPAIAWFLLLPFLLAILGEIFDRVPTDGGDDIA